MNPMNIICDSIPQLNRDILEHVLKRRTGNLDHENYLNASICDYKGITLLCYRTEQKPYCVNPRIHVVQLDDRCIPRGDNFTLETRTTKQSWRVDYAGKCHREHRQRAEDPRLCVVGDTLYVFWTDGFKMYYGPLGITIEDGVLKDAKLIDQWIPKPPFVAELAINPNYDRRQKNWCPFAHNDQLWVIYSHAPFMCCRLDGAKVVETVRHETTLSQYPYGFIKGGTPAIPLDEDRYITFFHSTKRMPMGDGSGKETSYYYMGALTFCRKTLKPLEISRYPLVAPYPDGDARRNNKLYVIFPCGVVKRDDVFIVSYGYNDHSIKLFATTQEQIDYNLEELHDSEVVELLKKKREEQVYVNKMPTDRRKRVRREPRARLSSSDD